MRTRAVFAATLVASACAAAIGCAAEAPDGVETESMSQAYGPAHINCDKVEPKDVLIAELVLNSVKADYPLTRLYVGSGGLITGDSVPDLVGGSLEVINTIPEARDSVAQALVKVSGEPDYGNVAISSSAPECDSVPAWTPDGVTLTSTTSELVSGPGVDDYSWKVAHKEFGKQCPLVKRHGDSDWVDPPGDGSTNLPASRTVSATGVRANAWGLCPYGTPPGTHCMLSYATGINWKGRRCSNYWGSLRCLVD